MKPRLPTRLKKLQDRIQGESLASLLSASCEKSIHYVDQLEQRPVFPGAKEIEALQLLDKPLPEVMGNAGSILNTLDSLGSPATVASTGGRYFGFVTGGVLPVALASSWLADTWDQNSALEVMSPIAAKLESVCEDWCKTLFGLPDSLAAGFVSGTSVATICGLAAARYRLCGAAGWDINAKGQNHAPPLRVVTGDAAHNTVIRALALLGFGTDNIEFVKTDDQGRIIAEQVPPLDGQTLLILQAGNVNSGAFDPFVDLCQQAREANAWVHIDGAFGLWAAACPETKHLTEGIELANSWSVDAHKTLNTPYDSGLILCSDREALSGALQTSGAYVLYSEQRDGMRYTPEMSRRARAIELWATLCFLGKQGVQDLVLGLHEMAVYMAAQLESQGFSILNDVVFNQIVVSTEDDAVVEKILELVQQDSTCWVGGSRFQGRSVIRVSICGWMTSVEDVNRSVAAFVKARQKIG